VVPNADITAVAKSIFQTSPFDASGHATTRHLIDSLYLAAALAFKVTWVTIL
jgi:hypothetical protein